MYCVCQHTDPGMALTHRGLTRFESGRYIRWRCINHHINKVGEKIACQAVEVDELINKKPTFEDIDAEEEDDTGGNYDSDSHTW